MKNLIVKIILNAAAIMLAANWIEGIHVSGWGPVFIASIILGIVNAVIRPVFLLLTLPLNVMSLGLLTFVINGLMLLLTSSIVGGFAITGVWPAILGAIVISVVSTVLNWLVS